MNIATLPNLLRELADRIEAAGLPAELTAEIDISLGTGGQGITDRQMLARVASLIGGSIDVSDGCHGRNFLRKWKYGIGIGWTAWFTAGLLGGEVKTTIADSKDGLRQLLEESAGA